MGDESIYKQYTYARNVIQWNIDIKNGINKYAKTSEINLRDDLTEGYNIMPNFFLSAKVNEKFDYTDDVIDKTDRKNRRHKKVHFENRLFDRNTLLLSHYDVNFLYVLSLYARNNALRKLNWKQQVREKICCEIQDWLQEEYNFYLLEPKDVSLEEAVNKHFKLLNGKIYRLNDNDNKLILALDKDKKFDTENESLLNEIDKDFNRTDYSLITP